MQNKVSIQLVLLGTQLHMSAIDKLKRYKSELFEIHSISSIATLPNTDLPDWSYSKPLLASLFKPSTEADITVGIIESRIEGNYFARRLSDSSGVVTFFQADDILRDANIDIFNYLLLTMYKLVTLFQMNDEHISEYSSEIIHDETRGCLFDMVGIKYDLVYSAANACICQECEVMLGKRNMPSLFLPSLKKELKKIRKSKYNRILEFVRKKPIISLVITAVSSIVLNLLASMIYDLLVP